MTFSQAAAASTFTIGFSFTPQWGMGRQQNINSNMIEPRNMINSYDGYKQYLQQGMAGGKPQEGKQYYQTFEEWYGKSGLGRTLMAINEWNPVANAANGIKGMMTGSTAIASVKRSVTCDNI